MMTSAVKKDIIVPDISIFPLHRISYDEIARKVLAANPGKGLFPYRCTRLSRLADRR